MAGGLLFGFAARASPAFGLQGTAAGPATLQPHLAVEAARVAMGPAAFRAAVGGQAQALGCVTVFGIIAAHHKMKHDD